jgi:hypothetical protein
VFVTTTPFGRYKRCRLDEFPGGYLDSLVHEANLDSPQLRRALLRELESRTCEESFRAGRRSAHSAANKQTARSWPLQTLHRRDVRSGYRTASKPWHPDQGGCGDQFRALHDSFEWLKGRIS